MPGEPQDELLMKIDFLISKVNELESVNVMKTEELHRRVQELEQFQHDYETAQEYERDR